ncbi:MAG: LysR family transcriptional regulator, partial [Paracoccus sp. (in: a-proteobacteria)]
MLNLRHIQYFIAIAESRSISAAAESLGMAQPSLSESIARLEQYFETPLAIRGARGIELTEAGAALARKGRRLLDICDMMTTEIREIGGAPSGQITLALPPSLGLILSVP